MKMETILGEPSWCLHSDCVSLAVTRRGGQLAPAEFVAGDRVIAPFHVAPWAGSKESRSLPPVLRALRGDFFCMPFGGNSTKWRSESHPVHGETANADWKLVRGGGGADWQELHLKMETTVRKASIDKHIFLRRGDLAIYSRHVVSGGRGPMPLGHHAMLACDGREALVSVAPFSRGQVFPGAFEDPASGGYSCLLPGGRFRSLDRVPMATGGFADLSHYPARAGFEDLVMLSSKPAPLAWTAVTFPGEGFVWFSLKDPRVLASTILWHSNGGRHYSPWSGRHRGVLGLEEVTGNFHHGLAESASGNAVQADGIPTALTLNPRLPVVVNTVMGVAPVPRGFDHVKTIRPASGGIELLSRKGKSILAACDTGFLQGEEARHRQD